MVSLFDRARDKLRRKDSDSSSRSSTPTRRSLSLSRKSKDKDKSKKTTLKYSNRSAPTSKESLSSSKRNSKFLAEAKAAEEADVKAAAVSEAAAAAVVADSSADLDENVEPEAQPEPEAQTETQPEAQAETQAEAEPPAEHPAEPVHEPIETIEPVEPVEPSPVAPPISPQAVPPQDYDDDDDDDSPKPDEAQPLLGPPPEVAQTSNYLSSPILSFTVIAVLLFIVVGYFVYVNTQDVVVSSVHPQVNGVRILAFTAEGLDVNIETSIAVNYTNISNILYQGLFAAGGYLMKSVSLRPQLPVEVTLNDNDTFNVTTPEQFVVGLRNGDVTKFSFNSTVSVSDVGLISLLNDLLEQDEVEVNVKSTFYADIGSRGLWLRHKKVSVDQDFVFQNGLDSVVEIADDSVVFDDDKIRFESLVKLNNNPYVNNYVLGESKFGVYLPDCSNQLTKFGEIFTSKWNMSSNNFSVRGLISEIPSALAKECKDGYSSINRLARAILGHQKPGLVLVSETRHKDLPEWLNNVITNVKFTVPEFPAERFLPSFNSSIDSADVQIGIQSFVSSNVTVDAPFSLSNLKAAVEAGGSRGSLVGELHNGVLSSSMEMVLKYGVGALLSDIINGEGANLDSLVNVESVDVSSGMFDGHLKDLNVSMKTLIPPLNISHVSDLMNVRIKDISVSQNPGYFIDLDVQPVIHNPFNYSLDLNEAITLNVMYNRVLIAAVVFNKVYIPANSDFVAKFRLSVEKSSQNEESLPEFINKFISGAEGIQVGLEFRCPEKPASFLNGIRVSGMEVPHIQFSDPEAPTPFVLESTIHIIGSDVELEILNPVDNVELEVELHEVVASYEGTQLGSMPSPTTFTVPPGVSRRRIPIKINPVGVDILKKALDGQLAVMTDAKFDLSVGKFKLPLNYKGDKLVSNIRL